MSDFYLYRYDREFDFVSGRLPDPLYFDFADTLGRARSVLKGQTPRQLRHGFRALDRLLGAGGDILMDQAVSTAEEEMFVDRVKALNALRASGQVDLTRRQFLPASWAQYFALLACAYIGEALLMYQADTTQLHDMLLKFGLDPREHDHTKSHIHEWALEAMDAVNHAERLDGNAKTVRDEMRRRGRKGGRSRVDKYAPLKLKVLDLRKQKYSGRSRRESAKRIWESDLTDQDRQALRTDEPAKTLEKWIGQAESRRIRKP